MHFRSIWIQRKEKMEWNGIEYDEKKKNNVFNWLLLGIYLHREREREREGRDINER